MAKKIYLSPSNQNCNKARTQTKWNSATGLRRQRKSTWNETDLRLNELKKVKTCGIASKSQINGVSDLHIPIYTNAGGGEGTVVFVYSKDANNMKYATPIYNSVQAVSPGKTDYGVREYADLAELNATSATAVYVECEFHDNATLAKWIVNHVDDLGEAIAKGVCKAEGKKYIKEKPAAAPAKKDTIYRVQVGAFSEKKSAEAMEKKLKKDGYSTIVKEEKK